MFEKEAFDYGMIYAKTTLLNTNKELEQAYKDGAEYGYNKALEEWKKCFLSCSSPYCSNNFPTIKSNGVLGCMEKIEK